MDRSFRHFHHKAIIRYYGEEDSGGGLILICEEEHRAGQRTLSRFAVVNTEGNVVQGYEQSCSVLRCCAREFPQKRSHTFTAMFLSVCHATCVFEKNFFVHEVFVLVDLESLCKVE